MKNDINRLLAQNSRVSYRGAPMGDTGYVAEDCPKNGLLCQALRMVDGGYGPDGTYWGTGSFQTGRMYVVANPENAEYKLANGVLKYYRAKSRADAIAAFSREFPGFTFARG